MLSLSRHLATGMGQRNDVDNVCEKGHPAKAYLSIELECEVQGDGKDSDDAPTDLVCFALREGYKVMVRILMMFLQLWCVWHSEASSVHYSALVYILQHQLLCPGNHAIATLCPHSQRH